MVPALVVSPHLDDAVLSVGRFLAGRPDVTVLTVFAGIPDGAAATTYDEVCGFASGSQAVVERRAEDLAALGSLSALPVWADLLDGQYRAEDPDPGEVVWAVDSALPAGADTVLVPLGIVHPDHLAVARASRSLVPGWLSAGIGVWVYSDLPGRVLWPEAEQAAYADWTACGFHLDLGFVGTGSKAAKRRALAAYRSQRRSLDIVEGWHVAVHSPERYWRVT